MDDGLIHSMVECHQILKWEWRHAIHREAKGTAHGEAAHSSVHEILHLLSSGNGGRKTWGLHVSGGWLDIRFREIPTRAGSWWRII